MPAKKAKKKTTRAKRKSTAKKAANAAEKALKKATLGIIDLKIFNKKKSSKTLKKDQYKIIGYKPDGTPIKKKVTSSGLWDV